MADWKVIILSRKPENCRCLIASILKNEPTLDLSRIIIAADGPREQWEQMDPRPTILYMGDKPFVFSRNANAGIALADSDVILMNDDTELMTPKGFTNLSLYAQNPTIGIVSPMVKGPCSKRRDFVAFVAVYISKRTQEKVGLLDERFVKYGYEDNDYCLRVKQAGLNIEVCSGCVVNHYHPDRSTFHGENNLYDGDNMVAFDRKYKIHRKYTWPEHLAQLTDEEKKLQ